MDHDHHLRISERESILFMCGEGKGIREFAVALGRASSTIMYQVILLSNCYQNEEKTPQTLDISRRLGQCYLFPLAPEK